MVQFHFPKEFCCPLQAHMQQYNSLLKFEMESLKLYYMQE